MWFLIKTNAMKLGCNKLGYEEPLGRNKQSIQSQMIPVTPLVTNNFGRSQVVR